MNNEIVDLERFILVLNKMSKELESMEVKWTKEEGFEIFNLNFDDQSISK